MKWQSKKFKIEADSPDATFETKEDENGKPIIGEITAKVATLGVIDHDLDIIEKDSVGEQTIIVSSWNHSSKQLFGPPPVGRGIIYEEGDALVAKMRYFLGITDSMDAYTRVKVLGEITEWSIGYIPQEYEWEEMSMDEQDPVAIRRLKKIVVNEASPVDRAAGLGTGTLEAKGENDSILRVERPSIEVAREIDLLFGFHKSQLDFDDLV